MWTTLMNLDLTSVCLALILGLIFMVLFEMFRINSCRGQIPPGPRPLPFVGTIPSFKKPLEAIRSLSQYGEMSAVYFGRKPMIVLNTIQVTKEAFVQEAFSGRPFMPLVDWLTKGLGIIIAPFGHSWRQQRRFALHTLRNFGLGKKSVEDRVLEESRYLIAEMLKAEGKSMDPQHDIQNAVSNIICSIMFGERFDYDNKRFSYLLKILNNHFMLTGSAAGQIVRVLGYDRLPSMDDRDKLPYTYATVHEIQRCANIAPLGVIHETIRPTKLRGYDFPQGTMVMTNLAAIFSDKEQWKHPDAFNPENFLDENGNFFKPESFIAFSLGESEGLSRGDSGEDGALLVHHVSLTADSILLAARATVHRHGWDHCPLSPADFSIICRSRDLR
ncbi:hypothetical protein cypCar_00038431 [Cyprinus carpio]|nr:hypothetical protein cypCar_00038431 [Cyprinus carpio]